MNYYPHHIGDFNNATRHLTRVERALYRDAIDLYYDTEQPLPGDDFDRLAKRLLAVSMEEKSALRDVLNEFFTLKDGAYHHSRCDAEIAKYRANAESKSKAGKASAAKRQHKATPVEHVLDGCATNQEPRTKNQEPLKAESTSLPDKPAKERKRASVLADDFLPNENGIAYAVGKHLSFDQELSGFRNWHSAKGTTFKDWQAAWRTWCDKAVEFGRAGNNSNGGANGKNGSSRADRLNNVIAELTGANRHPAPVIDGVAARVD